MIGNVIDGRYRVLRKLGEGGMATVYEAEHTETRRRVAVKVISAELAKHAGLVQRFQIEALAAGAIDTPHIARMLDSGTDPEASTPYMVMELLRGEDLRSLIERLGPLPPELALRVVGQACLGLSKAHEMGVIHRDIKPANLFLARREDGEITVKVLDFGIAKVRRGVSFAEEAKLTATGNMIGSPRYVSPEQAVGLPTIDHRTDIWSIGAALYEALSGNPPHWDCDNIGMLIMKICTCPPAPIQEIAPWVREEIAAIAHGALEIDVTARFPSMASMVAAILRVLPQGLDIREEMLVALPEQQHARRESVPCETDALPTRVHFPRSPLTAASFEVLPAPPGSSPFHIKGLAYRGFDAYANRHLEGGLSRLASGFRSPELRAFFAQPFMAGSWYDILPIVPLAAAIADRLGVPLDDFVRGCARLQAEHDAQGVYKPFFAERRPADLPPRLPRIFLQYSNFGGCNVAMGEVNDAVASRTGVPAWLLPWFIPANEAYIETVLSLMGSPSPRARALPTTRDGEVAGLPTVTVPLHMEW